MTSHNYKCTICGEDFFVWKSKGDSLEIDKCRKCGGECEELEKKSPLINYACGGFHNTDYK